MTRCFAAVLIYVSPVERTCSMLAIEFAPSGPRLAMEERQAARDILSAARTRFTEVLEAFQRRGEFAGKEEPSPRWGIGVSTPQE